MRWADSHRPPGVVEIDYITCDWKMSGARWSAREGREAFHDYSRKLLGAQDPRVWRQHFSLHSGRPFCLLCVKEHEPRPDSPFCSEGCAASYNVRNNIRSSQLAGHGHGCLGL